MKHSFLTTSFCFVLTLLSYPVQAELARVEKLASHTYSRDKDSPDEINLPYFDQQQKLQWNDSLIAEPAHDLCTSPPRVETENGTLREERHVLLASPRVDNVRCTNGKWWLLGINNDGVAWKQERDYQAGPHNIKQSISSTDRHAIVTSGLKVISTVDGSMLEPLRLRPVRKADYSLPAYEFYEPVYYHSARKEYLVSAMEKGTRHTGPGLHKFWPDTRASELMLPFEQKMGGLLGRVRIDAMARNKEGNLLYIAQHLGFRGPGWVELVVMDYDSKKVLFKDRYCEDDEFCEHLNLAVSDDGQLAFSYLNVNKSTFVVHHYRVKP